MLDTNPPGLDFAALRARIGGVVSTPGDPNWDDARQAWNLAVSTFYDEVSYARLRRIKAEVDPDNRIHGNHPIG